MITPVASLATDGAEWVMGWIAARFGDGLTATRYRRSWEKIHAYLNAKGIHCLSAITRQTCYDYFLWRTDAARNTAYAELRVLSVVLKEAVLRGLISANPCVQLGIKRLPAKKTKPEYTPEVLDEIERCIAQETGKHRDFYRISFAIARYHGVRIHETRFPLHWVDFTNNTITFRQKGQIDRTVPLHPKLRPVLLELVERGQGWTFSEPSNPSYMSTYWQKFLKRHGFIGRIPNACFHALRVTTISRLARKNISEAKAKRYVGHANSAVHAIYQRVRVSDLEDCVHALE